MELKTRFPIGIKIFSTEIGKVFGLEFRWVYYIEYPPSTDLMDISGMLKSYDDFYT